MEAEQAFGAADHLLARHRPTVRFQPAAPVARELVIQVPRLGVGFIAQHQVGLERVVGVANAGGRRVLVRLAGPGRRRGRLARRIEAGRIVVHLRQHGFERARHRFDHHGAHAGEVLVAQLARQLPALVQAEAQRPWLVLAVAIEQLDAVLQDVERFEPRLQVDAAGLQPGHLVEVGLHIGHQLAVAHIGPGPAAHRAAQQDRGPEEQAQLPARRRRMRVAPDQVAVGEDHLAKQVQQKVARLPGCRLGHRAFTIAQRQIEAAGHALARQVLHAAFLQRAGEVKAAKHGLELVGVFVEQRGQKGAQRRPDRREFEGKREHAGAHQGAAVGAHAGQAHLFQAIDERLELVVEEGQHVLRRAAAVVAQRGAPDALALGLFAAMEKVHETRHQIDLREHDIHGRMHAQALGQLLHAGAQVLGQFVRCRGRAGHQLGHADGDQDAVDRRTVAMAAQQVEKAEPLVAVVFLHRVAPGRVEQDAVGGEEPVAVAGAAHALHRLVAGDRKRQSRAHDGAALARRRVADDHIPRQFVQRRRAPRQAQLGRLDGADRV